MLILQTLSVGRQEVNCSILGCTETRQALVIDPGEEAERILEVLRLHRLDCSAILITHGHIDHVGAVGAVASSTGAEVLLHQADAPLYQRLAEQAMLFGFNPPTTVPIDRYLEDGESLRIGSVVGELRHTPGHSPGGLCLLIPGRENGQAGPPRLFAGDTLFAGSIGRTDLWGGNHTQLLRSIRERLLTLPDETIVIPGHGGTTTIGDERSWNPFLAEGREE